MANKDEGGKKTQLGFSAPKIGEIGDDDDATSPGESPVDGAPEAKKAKPIAPPKAAAPMDRITQKPPAPKGAAMKVEVPKARPVVLDSVQTIRESGSSVVDEKRKSADQFRVDDETIVTPHPFVEVELVYERGQAGMSTDSWRSLEIWTRNNVYSVDWTMRCTQVMNRETGAVIPDHSLLGAYLAGGQQQHADEGMELTYPCPRPGCEAVFEYRGVRTGFVNTSTVTRVVLRLRVLTVPTERVRPAWDSLSGVHKFPGKP